MPHTHSILPVPILGESTTDIAVPTETVEPTIVTVPVSATEPPVTLPPVVMVMPKPALAKVASLNTFSDTEVLALVAARTNSATRERMV